MQNVPRIFPAATERDPDPWREQLTLLLDSTGDGMFGIDFCAERVQAAEPSARLIARNAVFIYFSE